MFSDISYRLLRCVKHVTMQHCIIHCTWSTDNNAVCRKFRWQATNAFYRVLNAVFISHAILTFLKRVTVRRTNQCWFLTEKRALLLTWLRGQRGKEASRRAFHHQRLQQQQQQLSVQQTAGVQDLRLRPVNWHSIIHTESVRTVTASKYCARRQCLRQA